MGIRVVLSPDPRTKSSKRSDTILIGSAGAEQLERELRRYCQEEVEGRSFLIAGHRGAGKTTMVNYCVDRVEKAEGLRRTPLLIRLHGPNLVGEFASDEDPKGDAAGSETTAASPAKSSPARSQPQKDDRKPDAGTSGASRAPATDAGTGAAPGPGGGTNMATGAAAATGPAAGTAVGDALAKIEYVRKLQEDSNREKHPKRRKVQLALQQITLALHRALADKLIEAYRDRVAEKPFYEVSESRRRQLFERAAQLALELDQYTTPDRLRQFWRDGGFLETGVITTPESRGDQGFRELVALSAACQAYGRVSGTFANAEVKQTINSSQTTTLSTAKDGLDLISPLLSIVVGGITGTAMFVSPQGTAVQSAAAGLLAAFGSAALFKFTSSRSRTRTFSSDLTFVPDMRLDTLDRVLPTLIQRVSDIGLAPVFVIDELDKIDDLYDQLEDIVRHVKTIVAERAFFCFLTDRAYFERVVTVDANAPYPKHFTYFTDRVFVSFQPTDLHTYLQDLLKTEAYLQAQQLAAQAQPASAALTTPAVAAPTPTAKARDDDDIDLEILKFVLLRRCEMHAVRLRRQISSWSKNGQHDNSGAPVNTIQFARGVVRQLPRYKFDLLVQFAIELILHRPNIANRLQDDPTFARLI